MKLKSNENVRDEGPVQKTEDDKFGATLPLTVQRLSGHSFA